MVDELATAATSQLGLLLPASPRLMCFAGLVMIGTCSRIALLENCVLISAVGVASVHESKVLGNDQLGFRLFFCASVVAEQKNFTVSKNYDPSGI